MSDRNISVSISLPVEQLEYVNQLVYERRTNRSEVVQYLIRLGKIYLEDILPAQKEASL